MNPRSFCLLFIGCFSLASCRQDDIQTYAIPKEQPTSMPPGMTPPPGMNMMPDASAKEIAWKVPEGWIERKASSVRLGSFLVKGPNDGQADISVVPLSGEAGGDLSNINRWRGQIQLEPISESDFPNQSHRIIASGKKMVYVNMANQNKRLIAAIYHSPEKTWFFKMTGDDVAVQAQESAFRRFLSSLNFHDH